MRELPTTRSPRGSSADAGSRLRLPLAHVAKTAAGLGAFALVLRSIDVPEVGSQLRKSGAPAALVLLPPCFGLVLHSLAWKSLFRRGAAPRGLARLTLLHVAAEGIRLALPGGSALGEVAAARGAHALGASWRDSIASLVRKRGCLIATNGVWLMTLAIIAMLCGFGASADVSPRFAILGPQFAAIAALGLLCAGALVIRMLGWSPIVRRLASLPGHDDAQAKREGESTMGRNLAFASTMLLGQWVIEAGETWLTLRIVDVDASLLDAAYIESFGALGRAAAFFIPGGLGAQEASYLSVANALGVATGGGSIGSFLLLKRAKDLCLVLLGVVAAVRLPALVSRVSTEPSRTKRART